MKLNILEGAMTAAQTSASSVREVRKTAKLTQAQLAQQVGVSRQTIIAIERGDYAPSVYLALKIAKELDATVETLFHITDDAPHL